MLGYLLGYAFKSAWTVASASSALKVLPREERDAMRGSREYAGDEHLPGTPFVKLVRGRSTSEWFPALAQRVSLATVQGYEWLPNLQSPTGRQKPFNALQACASSDASCLTRWMAQTGITASHVYLGAGMLQAPRAVLAFLPGLRLGVRWYRSDDFCAQHRRSTDLSLSATKHTGGD